MKHKKNLYKSCFDIVMLILLVLIIVSGCLHVIEHDVMGLVLLLMVAVHLIYNRVWIKGVARIIRKSSGKSLPAKLKVRYRINLWLFIMFLLTSLSGVALSSLFFEARGLWHLLHLISALLTLILLGIHLRQHGAFLKASFKRASKSSLITH